jgi:hypothetical protein
LFALIARAASGFLLQFLDAFGSLGFGQVFVKLFFGFFAQSC